MKQKYKMYELNDYEGFLLRLSEIVEKNKEVNRIYEFSPKERLAEINSQCEINNIYNHFDIKSENLFKLLELEKNKKEIRGYHLCKGEYVKCPIELYLEISKKNDLLEDFCIEKAKCIFTESYREKLGFPISIEEFQHKANKILILHNMYNKNKI